MASTEEDTKLDAVITNKPNPVLNQIIQDVEFCGGRKKANFLAICKQSPGFYGGKGSELRRKYQLAFDRIKRKYTAQQYKKLVLACGVAPSAATIEDEMEELRQELAKVTVSEKAGDKNDKKVKIVEPTPKTPTAPVRSTTPTPATAAAKHIGDLTPPPSPSPFLAMQSPTLSVTSITETSDNNVDGLLDSTRGWSLDNPHIIPVARGNKPLPHGFAGMFSDSVQIGSYERDVFFISKTIGGDVVKWNASIPENGYFPEYAGRCVLVEGPAMDYIHADTSVVLESLNKTMELSKNEIPKNVASGLTRGLKKLSFKTIGKSQFYVFVFPPGTVFDNQAISGDGAASVVKTFGMRVNSKFGIFTKKEHTNIVCFWAIATQAEEDRRMDAFKGALGSDLFDL